MAESTPTLALVKPAGSEAVEVRVLNDNWDKVDAYAAEWGRVSGRNRTFYGPTSALGSATGMKRGDYYQCSDDYFGLFYYNGLNWKNRTRAAAQLVSQTATISGVMTPLWDFAAAGYVYQEGGKFWETSPPGNKADILFPYSGRYRITYTVRTNVVAPLAVAVQKNGADIGAFALASGAGVAGAASHAEHSFDYELLSTDKLQLKVTSNAANGANILIRIEYLGEL